MTKDYSNVIKKIDSIASKVYNDLQKPDRNLRYQILNFRHDQNQILYLMINLMFGNMVQIKLKGQQNH